MVTSEISKFESKFLAHMRGTHSGLLAKIKKEGKLDASDESELSRILDAFIPECGCAMKSWCLINVMTMNIIILWVSLL